MAPDPRNAQELLREIEELNQRLREAEETLEAIRGGEIDALVVTSPEGVERLFTLEGADHVYRVFLESITEGALTLTDDGVILYANEAADRLLSQSASGNVIGDQLRSSVRKDDRERFDALFNAARDKPASAEVQLRSRRGAHPVYLSLRPLDHPKVVVAVLTDLMELRRTEKVLEAERMARSILEQTSEAIVVCDTRGVIIRASRAVRDLVGQDPLFRLQAEVLPLRTADGSRWSTPTEDAFGPVKSLEVEFSHPDGSLHHLIMNVDPLSTPEEGFVGSVTTLTDITERKRAEEERAESERLYRTLFENNPVAVFLTAPDGSILGANPAACEMFGYTEADLVALQRADLVDAADPQLEAGVRRRREESFVRSLEVSAMRRGGERFPVELDSITLPGEPARSFVIVRDISERLRAEQALRDTEAKQAAEEARGRIARDLHDSMSQAIFAAALKAEALDVACGMSSDGPASAAREVSRLCRGALADLRSMLLELRGVALEQVPMAQLLRQLVESHEGRTRAEVKLTLEETARVPPSVHVAFYRVAQEALNNVARHAAAKRVWVEARFSEGEALLEVRDDGRGFEQRDFDTGHLGLHSMEERAQEIDAKFNIVSAANEGTSVTLSWGRSD